jgi:Fe-S cluster biogenesis protein NfuA
MKRSVPFVKEYIETVLAPRIQGDGGWVEYQSLEGDKLTLVFRGECSKCLILNRCTAWIEQKIKEDKGQTVTVVPVRKKPFFWDRV